MKCVCECVCLCVSARGAALGGRAAGGRSRWAPEAPPSHPDCACVPPSSAPPPARRTWALLPPWLPAKGGPRGPGAAPQRWELLNVLPSGSTCLSLSVSLTLTPRLRKGGEAARSLLSLQVSGRDTAVPGRRCSGIPSAASSAAWKALFFPIHFLFSSLSPAPLFLSAWTAWCMSLSPKYILGSLHFSNPSIKS